MKNVSVFVQLLAVFICQITVCIGRVEDRRLKGSVGKPHTGCQDCEHIGADLNGVRELIETLQAQVILLARKVKRCESRECGGRYATTGMEGVRNGPGPYEFHYGSREELNSFFSSGKRKEDHMELLRNMPKSQRHGHKDGDVTKAPLREIVNLVKNGLTRQGNRHNLTAIPRNGSKIVQGRKPPYEKGRHRTLFNSLDEDSPAESHQKLSRLSKYRLDRGEDESTKDPPTPRPYKMMKSGSRRKRTSITPSGEANITDSKMTITALATKIITSSTPPNRWKKSAVVCETG